MFCCDFKPYFLRKKTTFGFENAIFVGFALVFTFPLNLKDFISIFRSNPINILDKGFTVVFLNANVIKCEIIYFFFSFFLFGQVDFCGCILTPQFPLLGGFAHVQQVVQYHYK